MATSSTDFPARGTVVSAADGFVVINPTGTNYEVKLTVPKGDAPTAGRVDGLVRVTGRKLLTVPSGGNFVVPIKGPPRIIQGRVKYLDQTTMVVHCGLQVIVTLPTSDSSYDLASGGLAVGSLVNVTVLPGGSFEWINVPVATAV
jgi:hypothetical protein